MKCTQLTALIRKTFFFYIKKIPRLSAAGLILDETILKVNNLCLKYFFQSFAESKMTKKELAAKILEFLARSRIKKLRMKPSAVGFQKKNVFFGNIVVFEEWEFVFINQDNSREDELKIENRLKKYE